MPRRRGWIRRMRCRYRRGGRCSPHSGARSKPEPLKKHLRCLRKVWYDFFQKQVHVVFGNGLPPVSAIPVCRKEVILMKKTLRHKIHHFLASEEGQVAVKSPLVVGVGAGSLLLASTLLGATPTAAWWKECDFNHQCRHDQVCDFHTCRDR